MSTTAPDLMELTRDLSLALSEVKLVSTEQRLIEGHAAATGNLDKNGDIIEPGAFAETVKAGPGAITVLIGHDIEAMPVGELTKLSEDATGLRIEARIFQTVRGDEVLEVARDLNSRAKSLGMSIGFRVEDAEFKQQRIGDGDEIRIVRHIKSLTVREVSFAPAQITANPRAVVTGVKTETDDGDDAPVMVALPPGVDEEKAAAALAALAPTVGAADDEHEEGDGEKPDELTAEHADTMLAELALAGVAASLED